MYYLSKTTIVIYIYIYQNRSTYIEDRPWFWKGYGLHITITNIPYDLWPVHFCRYPDLKGVLNFCSSTWLLTWSILMCSNVLSIVQLPWYTADVKWDLSLEHLSHSNFIPSSDGWPLSVDTKTIEDMIYHTFQATIPFDAAVNGPTQSISSCGVKEFIANKSAQ